MEDLVLERNPRLAVGEDAADLLVWFATHGPEIIDHQEAAVQEIRRRATTSSSRSKSRPGSIM
jgi:hypothetical protein